VTKLKTSCLNVQIFLEPTAREIVAAMSRLLLNGKRGDTLFSYFNEHGCRIEIPSEINNTRHYECLDAADGNNIKLLLSCIIK